MNHTVTGKRKGQKCLENYIRRQRLILLFCQSRVRMMLSSREGRMGEGEETDAHQHLPQPRLHVSEGVAAPELVFHTGANLRKGKTGLGSQSYLASLLWAAQYIMEGAI